jgi:hypothetical protein
MMFADGQQGVAGAALLLPPAGLIAFFAFKSGGFYPGTAVVRRHPRVHRARRARHAGGAEPFEGAGPGLALATGGLALYALLTQPSEIGHVPRGRALVEFDRVLVYLLVMVLFGSVAESADRLRWILRALALAIVMICPCGLITRLLPHLWPTSEAIASIG